MGFSLRTTDPRLPEEDDTGPGGDRGCRFCNIMVAPTHERLLFSPMKVAVLKFVPLGKGDAAHFAARGLGATHTGAKAPPLPWSGFSEELFMPPCGATFHENSVPPWTRGDFRGVLNAATKPTALLSRSIGPSPTNTVHQPLPRWPLARHPLLN